MTREEVVLAKAARVRARLARVGATVAAGRDRFVAEEGLVEQAAFNLFLAMQEAIDLGSHILADEGWGAPDTLGEIFDLLAERGVIGAATATAMRRGTRLRNLIAHTYGDLDPGRLFDSAQAGLVEIDGFLVEVGAWLDRSRLR
ncbi:MAG: DUF86 domain-containing protein [Deltaproteobacteria bacterium]|nr:DUF86 domain-containing protein [Deltaproteobacteria bacterium]